MSAKPSVVRPSPLNENPYESPNAAGSQTPSANSPVRRWSLALCAALLNFAVWQLGIFFNSFGGAIDSLGASLCIATWFFAPVVIGGAIVYSPILDARTNVGFLWPCYCNSRIRNHALADALGHAVLTLHRSHNMFFTQGPGFVLGASFGLQIRSLRCRVLVCDAADTASLAT